MLSWQVVQANYIKSVLIGGEEKLRLDRMQDPEAVAQAITEHCTGCNVGHPGLVAHTDLVFLIQWKSYAGTDLEFSWETQDGLLGWAAYSHHLSLLQQYHNENGLQMAAAAAAPVVEEAVYDASYESGEDVPRLSHAMAAIQAADYGLNSSDSSDDADGNTDVEVQTDAEDEESDDSSTSEDDSDVSDDI